MKDKSPLLFSIFSFAFILLIIWFIGISAAGLEWNENIESLNKNWNSLNSISTIWRLEALAVCAIAWIAFNLSGHSKWWTLVAIGHILMLMEYIIMLGGYNQVTSEEMYNVLNGMANWTFIAANFIWVAGMLGIYWRESKVIKAVGVLLSASSLLLIAAIYFGLGAQTELTSVAMPVVLLLYAFNAYYGLVLFKRVKTEVNTSS